MIMIKDHQENMVNCLQSPWQVNDPPTVNAAPFATIRLDCPEVHSGRQIANEQPSGG